MFDSEIVKKAIIYRVFAVIITLVVGYLLTKNFKISLKIAFITQTLQTIAYYVFEYFWENKGAFPLLNPLQRY